MGSVPSDAFAFEIVGPTFLPLYRDGDLIIVSPSAPAKLGNRVLVQNVAGSVSARVLGLRSGKTIKF